MALKYQYDSNGNLEIRIDDLGGIEEARQYTYIRADEVS